MDVTFLSFRVLWGGGAVIRTPPPARAKVVQTPGRARVNIMPWAVHGKNRLQMVLVPPPLPNRRAVAPPLALTGTLRPVSDADAESAN